MSTSSLFDWLLLRDYDRALEHGRTSVIRRLARGNVSFQNGDILDDDALELLRRDGDRAIINLVNQLERSLDHGKNTGAQRFA